MGNGYNQHHQNLHIRHKTTFLPMLCSRPCIKDVAIHKCEDNSMSFSNDPLSPKIGCTGQVKRNNKIVGFPTSFNKITISTTKNDNNSLKYFKLKKIFSGKNLTGNTTTTAATASRPKSASCRRKEVIFDSGNGARIHGSKEDSVSGSVRIDEMDPPLPVIKKGPKIAGGGEGDSLWKRRSGGTPLRNLQLQQTQLNGHLLAPTTV